MNNENLYGWLFTFNPYTQLWNAAEREDSFQLFSGADRSSDDVLYNKNIDVLIELINKTEGKPSKIKKLVK